MSKVERTSAGLQIIIPGCERRTLPNKVASFLLVTHFVGARIRLCGPPRGKKHYRKAAYFLFSQQQGETQVAHRGPGSQVHRRSA